MSEEVSEQLSYAEKKVLMTLKGRISATPQEIRKDGGFRELVEVMNAASWLRSKGLVTMKERVVRFYSLARKQWATRDLPERRALKTLSKSRTAIPLSALKSKCHLTEKELSVAMGWMRRKGWCKLEKKGKESLVQITEKGKEALRKRGRDEELLVQLAEGEKAESEVDPEIIRMLKGRQDFLKEREEIRREITLTSKGAKIAEAGLELKEEVAQLTPSIIQSGKWKEVIIRPYDIKAFAPSVFPGKRHPLSWYIERIRRIFLNMGFTEIEGDYIQPAFWVFDALFQPQDHPARDMLDTFYLQRPQSAPLPSDEAVKRVAEVHETGGDTGSTGWRYKWERSEAERATLRPHTTPLSIRYLSEHPTPPQKAFVIGRNFRRDAIDATHLPEFHQIEGIVMEEGANLSMLIGILKEFYHRMGFEELRVRPGYFPYTEPSLEPEVYFNGEWMELGGAGIFRPEVTRPFGIRHPVLAWGLGLERLVMKVEGVQDMRQLYLSDIDWLRTHEMRL